MSARKNSAAVPENPVTARNRRLWVISRSAGGVPGRFDRVIVVPGDQAIDYESGDIPDTSPSDVTHAQA